MINYEVGITGFLLGLSLLGVGVGILYSYGQSLPPNEGEDSPPEFLFGIFAGFRLAAKISIVLGIVLLIGSSALTTDLHATRSGVDIPLTLYYACALGLLLIILSYNVIHHRVKGLLQTFGKDNPVTERIVRVHGNFTEYVPTGLALLLTIEWAGAPAMVIHTAGGIFTLGRYLHAWGYTASDGPHPGRMFGIQLTLLALSFMVIAAVYYLFII
jgi:uncharacterized membrane protein YecN with MAPEG domain